MLLLTTAVIALLLSLGLLGAVWARQNNRLQRPRLPWLAQWRIDQAKASFEAEVCAARVQGLLIDAGDCHRRVERLFSRLHAAAVQVHPHAAGRDWRIALIRNDAVNANARGDGDLVLYSGLWERAALSDAQLAFVLGHEMAHALLRHQPEQAAYSDLLQAMLRRLLPVAWQRADVGEQAQRLLYDLPLSREMEFEADELAVYLMHVAGLDVSACVAPAVLGQTGQSLEQWLSTHPCAEVRVQRIERLIASLAPGAADATRFAARQDCQIGQEA